MATSFEFEAMIWGYQEYKDVWEAEVADKLQYQRELMWDMSAPIRRCKNFSLFYSFSSQLVEASERQM